MTLSLKRRLIGILLALMVVAWGSSTLVTALYASRVMLAQVDRQLVQYSDLVNFITEVFARQAEEGLPLAEPWSIEEIEGQLPGPMLIEGSIDQSLAPALNIWLGSKLLAALDSSPHFAKPEEEGFSYRHLAADDSHWRVYSRFDERTGLWLLVGIEVDAARWAMLTIFGRALFPLLFILPLTIAILYFGVTRGLRPVQALAEQIGQRNPKALEPVVPQEIPEELQPVVAELNALLDRLGFALEGEQRFTANAAHELMTPLAAIKTEVQLCQRMLEDPQGVQMLQRIGLRVDRATHTVEQLLTLARVDPDTPMPVNEVDFAALIVEIAAETAHLARERHLELRVGDLAASRIAGSEEALAILLRNLLINAFRYAQEETAVSVEFTHEKASPTLEIANRCAPLSAEEFARISERFYRVPGGGGLGAGLGLSIVSRIAQHHGAQFTAEPASDGAGFCARVVFPEPTARERGRRR